MKYAKDTEVSVSKSRAEIEDTVTRYKANGFMSGWMDDRAMIAFEMKGRRLRFMLPLPSKGDRRFHFTDHKNARRSPELAEKAWEQACRQKWRALALVIKAKLEAVESEISTFEEEFMANIVLANGLTIGETFVPRMNEIVGTGKLPPLLPAPGQSMSQ